MLLRLAPLSLLTAAALSVAQAPPPAAPGQSSLDALLNQVSTYAAAYRATLPSLTADEGITSQGLGFGPFKQRAEARAIFRVIRKSPDAPLEESRQIVELNGKHVAADQQVHLPLTFKGAFGDALEIFFAPALRPCFDFTLAPTRAADGVQRIDFVVHPGSESNPACAHTSAGAAGFVLIDPANKQIRHLERTVPASFADSHHLAEFVSMDYAPTPVGERSFWLPKEIAARTGDGRAQFTARYSNYHRFTGTMTVLPNVSSGDSPL